MATRRYFSDLLLPPVTGFTGASGWANAASMTATARLLAPSKLGEALADRNAVETSASVQNTGLRMHLSEELAAQTIAGTFSAVIRCLESSASADMSLQCIVRVLSQDCSTVRATLYAGEAAALNATVGALGEEMATTAATRIIPAGTALSSYTCVAGDRLSVETGARDYNTVTTSFTATLRYGTPSGTADFALTSGLTTDLVPWVEFSQDLLFARKGPVVALRQAVNRAGSF